MQADVAQRSGPQQRITQCVQGNVTIGMRFQSQVVGDAHTAQGDVVAGAESVHIQAVADTKVHGFILPRRG
jgi:hypothetical protein